ncbi:MAG: hypothetical protein AAGD05_18185, partial [Bacteroidota bacterium]
MSLSIPLRAQTCSSEGNVVIFSNYDGGYLNINIDEDIPNLKIGIASYEPTEVNIFGPFVDNVVQVVYAGFNPLIGTGNFHCDPNLSVTSINPIPNGITEILSNPPVSLEATEYDTTFFGTSFFVDLIGNNQSIIGCSSCDMTQGTGGSNSPDQIIDFFANYFADDVRFLKTQYGCWCGTQDLSLPTSCCVELSPSTTSIPITPSSPSICDNETISLSAPSYTGNYLWSTGETNNSIEVNEPGVYTLTIESACGSQSGSITIIQSCPTEDCNNGLDDDGDGLVDLNDPDCNCASGPILTVKDFDNLFRNPSFEDFLSTGNCIPNGFTCPFP